MSDSGRGLIARAHAAIDVMVREAVKFGAVGALAFVIDLYIYNVLRTGWWPLNRSEAVFHDKPLLSKVASVGVAVIVAWLGNRYWTFRHRRRIALRREFVLFAVMNIVGLGISLGCLWVSHYALDLTSALADNISGNVIGLGLGTLFRFWAYRSFVFNHVEEQIEALDPDVAPHSPSPQEIDPASVA